MTPDSHYNPDCDIFLGIDKGFRNPNVTLWIQPDRKWERIIVLFAHYQVLRTPDENARIALAIHQARGYGQLTGGWGDPSAPDMLRAYSLAFVEEILGPRQSLAWGHEAVTQWLKTARMTKGAAGLVFSRECPRDLLMEMSQYEKHEPGKGAHHGPDALRYFFQRGDSKPGFSTGQAKLQMSAPSPWRRRGSPGSQVKLAKAGRRRHRNRQEVSTSEENRKAEGFLS